MKLQRFGINESQYERPNQKWVCGWNCHGRPCTKGPDEKGNCRTTTECTPIRTGDRWQCKRHESQGGTCERGPSPHGECCRSIPKCQPGRNLRSKRGLVCFWTVVATLGCILFLTNSTYRKNFISPGSLSSHHGTLANDCKACHTTEQSTKPELADSNFPNESQIQDSRLCLKCHENMGENSLNAHNLHPPFLASLEDKTQQYTSSGDSSSHSSHGSSNSHEMSTNQALKCSVCHREHHGKDFQLTQIGNQRCQSCHVNNFTSFAKGHPEFGNYPFEQRTKIIFDHNSHFHKHFKRNRRKNPLPNV